MDFLLGSAVIGRLRPLTTSTCGRLRPSLPSRREKAWPHPNKSSPEKLTGFLLGTLYGAFRKEQWCLKDSLTRLRPQNSCPSSLAGCLIWPALGRSPLIPWVTASGGYGASVCPSWITRCPTAKLAQLLPSNVERLVVGSTRRPGTDSRHGEVPARKFTERSAGGRSNLGAAL
jgi:hypothetical protein